MRRVIRRTYVYEWHRWWAWKPVQVVSGRLFGNHVESVWAWLETIERKRIPGDSLTSNVPSQWIYRMLS